MKKILFLLFASGSIYLFSQENKKDYSIEPYSKIGFDKIKEGSALLKSPSYKDIYWTLNDSGNPPVIYPIDSNGKIIKPDWVKDYKGIKILDALNIDWEWLTSDDNGDLIIGDTGNNYNYRKDLALYKVAEPNPYYANESGIIAKYPIKYPDQNSFPPDENNFNFDLEAGYYYNGNLYIISKNRSGSNAKIYKFDELKPYQINIPKLIDTFDFKSMVTDAAISPDKKYLAVLTYNYVWLFERGDSDSFFKGKINKKEIKLGQCEGISFNGDFIIISNEEKDLFKINLKEIR